jgi:hypothetical protein
MPDNTRNEIIQLKRLLSEAVGAAYREEHLLCNINGENREGIEQTVVFRVGIHLHELLKESPYASLNLDCEYNKCGDDPKKIVEFKNDTLQKTGIQPDLLIHSRGNHINNRLIVEFKGWWNKKFEEEIDKDIEKLKKLTSSSQEYKYLLGVMVIFQKDTPKYHYFSNGEEIHI